MRLFRTASKTERNNFYKKNLLIFQGPSNIAEKKNRKQRKWQLNSTKRTVISSVPFAVNTSSHPLQRALRGHLLCSKCREIIDLCAICQPDKWCRNRLAERSYERIYGSQASKCKNSANGCEAVFANNPAKEAHEVDKCRYLCQRCPGKSLYQRPPSQAWFTDGTSTVELMPVEDWNKSWYME